MDDVWDNGRQVVAERDVPQALASTCLVWGEASLGYARIYLHGVCCAELCRCESSEYLCLHVVNFVKVLGLPGALDCLTRKGERGRVTQPKATKLAWSEWGRDTYVIKPTLTQRVANSGVFMRIAWTRERCNP